MNKVLLAGFLLLASSVVFAQKGSVKGFVSDKKSGEGIPFASVRIDSTDFGATTDVEGFFSIPNVPVGTYKLVVSNLGFQISTTEVEIKKNQTAQMKIFLEEKPVELTGVEISAEKQQKKNESRVSVTTVSPTDIKRIPTVGGEADIAQYLQVLPGVVSTGDQGGQVVIRGGTPVQTKFMLDGITIYNPFHSIGLFSVFETDIIKNVDVYTGGFPSEYGGRISAVVDVTTKDGNRKKVSGKVGASPFMAHALLEIPVIKLREDKRTSASIILNTKISYLDRTSKVLYPYAGNDGLPYNFYDAYGKFSLSVGNNLKMNISGFNFRDNAGFSAANYTWNNWGIGANFLAVPKNSNLYFNTHVSYSQYEVKLVEADNLPRRSSIGGFDIGMDFTYYLKNGDVKYGLNVEGNRTIFEFYNKFRQLIDQNQNTTDLGAYFHVHKVFNRFVIEAGGRLQYYGNIQAISPEPRLSMKYSITDYLRLKVAGGMYSQNFISTKSDKDVVNLFNGFITGPDESLENNTGKEIKKNMQRSVHAIFGAELDLPYNITFNIEPYYKYLWNVININRYKQFTSDPNFQVETGNSYGLDVTGKWEYKHFYFYMTYSLAWSDRNDGIIKYPPHFDRRHNMNIVSSYQFGKKLGWEVSARFNLGSGFPFTKTQAFYEGLNFQDGINTDITSGNGNLNVIYETQINNGRLPYYHRLDLAIKKTFNIKDKLKIELNASVSNVYNRKNLYYFDRVRFTRVNQLPIIPSFGMSFAF